MRGCDEEIKEEKKKKIMYWQAIRTLSINGT